MAQNRGPVHVVVVSTEEHLLKWKLFMSNLTNGVRTRWMKFKRTYTLKCQPKSSAQVKSLMSREYKNEPLHEELNFDRWDHLSIWLNILPVSILPGQWFAQVLLLFSNMFPLVLPFDNEVTLVKGGVSAWSIKSDVLNFTLKFRGFYSHFAKAPNICFIGPLQPIECMQPILSPSLPLILTYAFFWCHVIHFHSVDSYIYST